MKTKRLPRLLTAAFCLAAFTTAGCAEKAKTETAALPAARQPAPAPTPAGAKAAPSAPVDLPVLRASSADVAPVAASETAPPARNDTADAVTPATPPATVPATTALPPATWVEFQEIAYADRAALFAGLHRLEAHVDTQIAELTAQRAAFAPTASTADWDFAMKEMGNARSYLKGMGEELRRATPETWNQQKDKVGQAWVRTQDAYGKVKASTTTSNG